MTIQEALIEARRQLSDPRMYRPDDVAYFLRDFPEVEQAELRSLAWSMVANGCHRNDVLFLIEHIERWLKQQGDS